MSVVYLTASIGHPPLKKSRSALAGKPPFTPDPAVHWQLMAADEALLELKHRSHVASVLYPFEQRYHEASIGPFDSAFAGQCVTSTCSETLDPCHQSPQVEAASLSPPSNRLLIQDAVGHDCGFMTGSAGTLPECFCCLLGLCLLWLRVFSCIDSSTARSAATFALPDSQP